MRFGWAGLRRSRPFLGAALLSFLCSLACPAGCRAERIELEVDASAGQGPLLPIWDEVNIWKLYGYFNPEPWNLTERLGDGWASRWIPFAKYARFPAALGGNYSPAVSRSCDLGEASQGHPFRPSECGRAARSGAGSCGSACKYEIVKGAGPGGLRTDFGYFHACLKRLLRGGLLPHMNVSSAHTAFTGGKYSGRDYHWNAEPVEDMALWKDFIRRAFRELSAYPSLADWRFSVINEPNCLRRDGAGGSSSARHVGYNGGPDRYAQTLVETVLSAKEAAPGTRFQLGNYVASDTFPGEFNLESYLEALGSALLERGVDRRAFRHIAFSFYETRDDARDLYGFREHFKRIRAVLERSGYGDIPMKIDEYDVHPELKEPFDEGHRQALDATLYAASWHAKAVKSFLDHGIVSAAPWLPNMFDMARWRPYPKYYVYLFYAALAGQIEPLDRASFAFQALPEDRREASRRLKISGEIVPAYAGNMEPYWSVEAVGAGMRDKDVIRVLLFHHQSLPQDDGEVASDPRFKRIRLSIKHWAASAYRFRWTGLSLPGVGPGAGNGYGAWDASAHRCREPRWTYRAASAPFVELDLPKNTVILLEARALGAR